MLQGLGLCEALGDGALRPPRQQQAMQAVSQSQEEASPSSIATSAEETSPDTCQWRLSICCKNDAGGTCCLCSPFRNGTYSCEHTKQQPPLSLPCTLLHIVPEESGASAAGALTMMPFLVSDSRWRLGRIMSQDSSPTTPAVRSTSHFSSLAGCRAAAMVLRLAPARTVTCCQ